MLLALLLLPLVAVCCLLFISGHVDKSQTTEKDIICSKTVSLATLSPSLLLPLMHLLVSHVYLD